VADIANQLGYWHMGGFAQDFKRLFKVSPTELLRLDADKL
jgi:AraC-like DNA-binding protein